MDFGTLAQLSNPGQTPLGGKVVDPLGYSRWSNLAQMQQEHLRSAVPLAQMNMQQEQQKNAEFMAGAPGRMDTIKLGNKNAAANVQNFDRDQKLKELDAQLNDADKRAKLMNFTSDIGNMADGYESSTPVQKQQMQEQLKGKKLRNGYIMGSDPVTDDFVLSAAERVRKYEPKVRSGVEKEEIKQTGAMERLKAKGINDIEIANIKAKHAAELQGARLAQSQNKPLTASQAEAAAVEAVYGNDDEGKVKYWFTKNQTTGATAIAAGRAASVTGMTGGSVKVEGPQVAAPPAVNPDVVKKPTTNNKSKEPKEPVAGSPWQKEDGSKVEITKVERSKSDKTKYRITLKDGTVIEESIK